ncbi:cyclin-dependent kinase inhibitor 2c-related [Anaeramoeba flamelloides]|uniref:Cyclin-dependent kinase inhibitor 2c-related n=1 Tax=Anaeramoeba flamelloides TaxID=1746091 RepID=A0AAV7ZTM2_9EUKA|nr:cyclin-dependent kinase inhibitor 2c-related [Anaeramoeba flamelloides]
MTTDKLKFQDDKTWSRELQLSIRNNQEEKLENILKSNPEYLDQINNPDKWTVKHKSTTWLIFAIRQKNLNTIKILLDNGADPKILPKRKTTTTLIEAFKTQNKEIVELIQKSNPDVLQITKDNTDAFSESISSKNLNWVKWVFEQDREHFSQKQLKKTYVSYAIEDGNLEILDFLLISGLNPHEKNDDSTSPVLLACERNSTEYVKKLLEYKCDPNCVDQDGWFPLLSATLNSNPEMILMLLKNGANPTQTLKGNSPLHFAVKEKNSKIAELLLQYAVNILEVNEDNLTPLEIASIHGNAEIIEMILIKSNQLVKKDNKLVNSIRERAKKVAKSEKIAKLFDNDWSGYINGLNNLSLRSEYIPILEPKKTNNNNINIKNNSNKNNNGLLVNSQQIQKRPNGKLTEKQELEIELQQIQSLNQNLKQAIDDRKKDLEQLNIEK